VYYGSLRQNLHHLHVFSGEPHVNKGETGKMRVDKADSRWIQLKVGIQCVLFLVGLGSFSKLMIKHLSQIVQEKKSVLDILNFSKFN